MYLFLICIATVLATNKVLVMADECDCDTSLIQNETLQLAVAYEIDDIVPEIMPKAPVYKLGVKFDTAEANYGNVICPAKTILPPMYSYDEIVATALYTLLVIDPDVPSASTPALRSFLNSLCVNIRGSQFYESSGTQIAPWIQPSPAPKSGKHRIIINLYVQPRLIDTTNRDLVNLSVFRFRFNLTQFVSNYTLGNPIAGNYFRSAIPKDYEKYCKEEPVVQCCKEEKDCK